ncbi:unnamed protein product [Ectocarpus sp. CCAP 1310/34]|nr:unnamed protein product [Ectocarpus sp. CCAP 1310/34]
MVKFNLKLAPKKTKLGVKVVPFLGHQATAEGIGPDPGKVRPLREVPMPTNVSQLRSLLGSLSYYRKFLKNMSAKLKPINAMLKKGEKFAFTADHVAVVRKMMDILSGPTVLAFPCYEGAISGERPFRLTADASISGLGAVIEQEQRDGSIRPLCFLSRSTFPNETRWSPTKLEAGAIVWAIKQNRTLFYGIPFEVYSDHQPLRNLGSLAEKNNRVQRWYDFLSAYTYELKYRPGRENANADLMSRLPLPATKEDEAPDVRLTDPSDLDVYMIGASGVIPSRLGPVYTEREALAGSNHRDDFVVGEGGCTSASLTTDELADKTWALIQRGKDVSNPLPDGACVPDDTRGRGSGGRGPAAPPLPQIPLQEYDEEQTQAAIEFGEKLCDKTASDWADIQEEDDTARLAITAIEGHADPKRMKEGDIPEGVDVDLDELKRLVSQGTLLVLPNSKHLLVRKELKAPAENPNRNPGQFERWVGEEPVRTYVPRMLRPWVMDCAHKEAVHLGEKVTLGILQRVYWWIGMAESVRWWIRRCYSCQFRKVPRHTKCWPLVSLPLPSRPGQMVSFDYLGPLPKTTKDNEYVFLVVDLFSRHAEGYPLTKAQKNAKGFVSIMVNDYIARWGCPHTMLSDRGAEFANEVAKGVYKMLGTVKKFTSSYHPQTNGMVERLNHTLCQMLSHLVADDQANWDEMLPHAVAAHNNNVSRGTGLAPNVVHIGRYPRLPMTILEGRGVSGNQGLKQDQLDYLNLMRDKQRKAYELVREQDKITKSKHEKSNQVLNSIIGKRPKYKEGDWVLVYDEKSTISGGGEHVLKSRMNSRGKEKSFALIPKLAHNWTGPYKVLFVGPGTDPEGEKVGPNILYLDVNKDEPGTNINERVSVYRCKKCYTQHENEDRPRFLPWGFSKYVLNKFSELAPPFHLTAEDVEEEVDSRELVPCKISRHRICRGISGKGAVQYYTHWTGLAKCTWEHEVELEQYGDVVLKYWNEQPEQSAGGNIRYRRYRIQGAKRTIASRKGERHVQKDYKLCCDIRGRPSLRSKAMIGAYLYFKTVKAGWQFAKVVQSNTGQN